MSGQTAQDLWGTLLKDVINPLYRLHNNGEYSEVEANGVKKKRVFAPSQTMLVYTYVLLCC